MPKYYYRCKKCNSEYEEWHLIEEKTSGCENCNNKDLNEIVKIPCFSWFKFSGEKKNNKKVGQVTNDFIEEVREDLKEMKRELKDKASK